MAALYSESDWPVLGRALAEAENGDPTGIFSLADSYNGRNDDGTFNTLFQSFPVIRCASGIEAPSQPTIRRHWQPRCGRCPSIRQGPHRPTISPKTHAVQRVGRQGRTACELSYAGDGPIVLVGGTNDPATPIRWAQKMARRAGPERSAGDLHRRRSRPAAGEHLRDRHRGAVLADLTLPGPRHRLRARPGRRQAGLVGRAASARRHLRRGRSRTCCRACLARIRRRCSASCAPRR